MRRFFIPGFAPVYIIGGASFAGALLLQYPPDWIYALLHNHWSPQYLLLATFMHAGFWHALLNSAALFFIGGQMLLPLLSTGQWLWLFGGGALAGHLANNLFGNTPAVGISAAVLAMLGCAIFPFGKMPVIDSRYFAPAAFSFVIGSGFFCRTGYYRYYFQLAFFRPQRTLGGLCLWRALWLFAFSPPFVITATLTQSAASLSVG